VGAMFVRLTSTAPVISRSSPSAAIGTASARQVAKPRSHSLAGTAAILALGGTNNRYYSVDTGLGQLNTGGRPSLLGYPVHFSNKVDAYGNGQPILFGNFNYVGLYESPTLQMLRDPFSRASYGQTAYHAYFRADYGVLQSGAVGYFRHINT
jgi:HK97 family phage major capsid protein